MNNYSEYSVFSKLAPYFVIVFSFLLLLFPLAVNNHIYSNIVNSNDYWYHTKIVDEISQNNLTTDIGYPAQVIFGYPLGIIDNIIKADSKILFYIFSSIVLVVIGIIFYKLGKYVNGNSKYSGWITVITGLFCTTSILAMFNYGVVYSLINVYIMFIGGVFLLIRYVESKKLINLVGCTFLFLMFLFLHPTGIYLPITGAISCILILITERKKFKLEDKIITIILIPSFICLQFLINKFNNTFIMDSSIQGGNKDYSIISHLTNFTTYLTEYISPFTIGTGLITAIFIVCYFKDVINRFNNDVKLKLISIILGSLLLTLTGTSIFISSEVAASRMMIDFSVILSILIAIYFIQILDIVKTKVNNIKYLLVKYFGIALASGGSLMTLIIWVTNK